MPDRVSSALTEVRTVHSRANTALYFIEREIQGLAHRLYKGTDLDREPHTLEELEEIEDALTQVVRITDKFAKQNRRVHR